MASPVNTSNLKPKSKKRRGWFRISGYHHLPEDVKRIVWKELKIGDEIKLIADPNNKHDNYAIKVLFHNNHIGWFPMGHEKQAEIFNALTSGINVKAYCESNVRGADYYWGYTPGLDGDKYLGMAQFVVVKYKYSI